MNKKKEIIKIIIYVIIIVIITMFYFHTKEVSEQTWNCITTPCSENNSSEYIPYLVGLIIFDIIFIILSINSIIKLLRNK